MVGVHEIHVHVSSVEHTSVAIVVLQLRSYGLVFLSKWVSLFQRLFIWGQVLKKRGIQFVFFLFTLQEVERRVWLKTKKNVRELERRHMSMYLP